MAVHHIELSQESLIGSFTKETPAILSVRSGDRIQFQTLDAGWGTGTGYRERIKPFARRESIDSGHALIGPFYIENAKRGMTLEITFNRMIPGAYGFTSAGNYPNWQNQKLNLTQYDEMTLEWSLDTRNMTGACEINGKPFTVELSPFMGVIGMPPEETGIHSTWPPRFCGGNLDCKELVEGSRLYLPIPWTGAISPSETATPGKATAKSAAKRSNAPWNSWM